MFLKSGSGAIVLVFFYIFCVFFEFCSAVHFGTFSMSSTFRGEARRGCAEVGEDGMAGGREGGNGQRPGRREERREGHRRSGWRRVH
jgi:hypothetical protein